MTCAAKRAISVCCGEDWRRTREQPAASKSARRWLDLLGGADEAGLEAAVGDGVVAEGDFLFELRAGDPLLVVGEAGGGLCGVGLLAVMRSTSAVGFGFGVADDAVAGDAEDHLGEVRVLGAACAHVGDFGGDGGGVVAVHEVGVALGGDEVFGGFGFAAGVEGGTAVDSG